ncbi:hypothetical protein GCM10010401_00130 [Rarobacter faecitabidus]
MAAVGVAVIALLGACVPTTPSSPGEAPASFDLESAIGNWTVADSGTDADGAILQIGWSLALSRQCGYSLVSYIIKPNGDFVASDGGYTQDCGPGSFIPERGKFRFVGDRLEIVDESSATIAELTRGGEPHVTGDTSPELAQEPVYSAELAAAVQLLAPANLSLPDDARVATAADLSAHRWYPENPAPEDPGGSWIDLRADGRYETSDGCNGMVGLWLVDDSTGAFRATGGGKNEVGCPGVETDADLMSAHAMAVTGDGSALLFFDEAGQQAARYVGHPNPKSQQSTSPDAVGLLKQLVGKWVGTESRDGEGMALTIGRDLVVSRPCDAWDNGASVAYLLTADGRFVTGRTWMLDTCDEPPAIPIEGRFSLTDGHLALEDLQGNTLALFDRDDSAAAVDGAEDPLDDIASKVIAEFSASLPDGLRPVTQDLLTSRRWYAIERPSGERGESWNEFGKDGVETAFDSCNESSRGWVIDDAGIIAFTTVMESTLVGCDIDTERNEGWSSVKALAITADDEELVAVDSQGRELMRFHR